MRAELKRLHDFFVFDRTGNERFGAVSHGNSQAIIAHSALDIRARLQSFPPRKV